MEFLTPPTRTIAFGKRRISVDHTKLVCWWLVIITACATLFSFLAIRMQAKPLEFQAPFANAYAPRNPEVRLSAEVVSADPLSRTIAMNWYPVLREPSGTSVCSSLNGSNEIVVDILLPTNILDMSSPTWTAQVGPPLPAFRLNSTEVCNSLSVPYPSFRTVTKLIPSKESLGVSGLKKQSNYQAYPFDVYIAPMLIYSQNLDTGAMRGVEISDSFGIAVNFEITLVESMVGRSSLQENLQIILKVERSLATKTFVIVVVIINWLAAILFLIICTTTVLYKDPAIYSEIFVVPIGALFAFTSIRSNFPGAPAGFGATIDVFTIIPVLVTMSLCGFLLLLIILYRRIGELKEKNEESVPIVQVHRDPSQISVGGKVHNTTGLGCLLKKSYVDARSMTCSLSLNSEPSDTGRHDSMEISEVSQAHRTTQIS